MKRGVARWGAGAAVLVLLGTCLNAAEPSPATQRSPAPASDFSFPGPFIQGGIAIGTAPAGTRELRFGNIAVPVAPDGKFLIAFDRDAAPTATLTATRNDGSVVTCALTIAPRAWRIERLTTLLRFPQPSAEFNERRPPELAQIAAARDRATGSEGWRQHFIWPATGRISGLFGSQRVYRGEPGAYHSGVDVAKPEGAVVVAPADGVVILAADHPFTLEGNLLMIDHGVGLNSAFLHLSRIDVHVGDHVRQGEPIGRVGHTGRATGPHLHWGMKWGDSRIDPLLVAGPMP